MNLQKALRNLNEVDKTTYEHSLRVGNMAKQLACFCGFSEGVANIYRDCGYVHDLGKQGVMKYIKSEVNVRDLSIEEEINYISALKKHVVYSNYVKLLSDVREEWVNAAEFHHVNYDGTGYSRKSILGEKNPSFKAIPFEARLIHIIDVYDALTSKRSYKEGFSKKETRKIMDEECELGHFDTKLYKSFVKFIDWEENK